MIRGYKTNIKHEYTKTKFGRSINFFWYHDTCGCGRLKQKPSPHCRWCCFNRFHCISKGINTYKKTKEYLEKIEEKKKARLLKIELRKKLIQQRVNKFSHRRLKIIEYLKLGKYAQQFIAKRFRTSQSYISVLNKKYVKKFS